MHGAPAFDDHPGGRKDFPGAAAGVGSRRCAVTGKAREGSGPLAELLRQVVKDALAGSERDQDGTEALLQQHRAHADYLRERLDGVEAELASARETAAPLATQLQVVQSQAAFFSKNSSLWSRPRSPRRRR